LDVPLTFYAKGLEVKKAECGQFTVRSGEDLGRIELKVRSAEFEDKLDVWVMKNFRSEESSALLAFGSRFVWNLLDGPVKELAEPSRTIEVYENNKKVESSLFLVKALAKNQIEVVCGYPSSYSLSPTYNVTLKQTAVPSTQLPNPLNYSAWIAITCQEPNSIGISLTHA